MKRKMLAFAIALAVGISGIQGNMVYASETYQAIDETEITVSDDEVNDEVSDDEGEPAEMITKDTGTLENRIFRQTFGSSCNRSDIQKAFDNIKNGTADKVEITLEGNIEIKGRLIVYSNTVIDARRAVITQKAVSGSILKSATAEDYGKLPHGNGYQATENIKVMGGTWNGAKISGQVIRFVHSSNVTLEGLKVSNCTSTGHLITLEGVENAVIQNCTLTGHDEMENIKEAIHLDIVHSQKTTPGLLEHEYDDLPDKNIVIRNNKITNSANGVGSHAAVDGVYHQNIRIENNQFDNIRNTAVRLYNYKNVLASQNTISNSAMGIRIYTFLPNGYKPNKGVRTEPIPRNHNYNIIVRSNRFTSINGLAAIYVLGSASRPVYNCKIEGNTVNGAASRGIWLSSFSGYAAVTGNSVNNAASSGICVEESSNGSKIENNTLKSSGKSGITVTENCSGIRIKNNRIADSKGHGIWVYDRTANVTISANTVKGAEKDGIYISSLSNGITVKSNTIKGTVKQHGICVSNYSSALMEKNKISTAKKYGIFVNEKSRGTIKKNTISKIDQHGIFVNRNSSGLMENNKVNSVKQNGIYVNQSNTAAMNNNKISKAGQHGIYISKSVSERVEKNQIETVGKNGIIVSESQGCVLKENTITGASVRGIHISSSKTPSVISKNNIKNSGEHGIHVYHSKKTEIKGNRVTDVKGRGINLSEGCKESEISKNSIVNTRQQGISSYQASYVSIVGNTVSGSRKDGISAGQAGKFVEISGNKVTDAKGAGINVWTVKKADINDNILQNVGKIAFKINETKSKVKTTPNTSVNRISGKKKQISGKARKGSQYSVTVGKKKYKVGVKNGGFQTEKIKKIKKGTKVKVVERIAGGNQIQTVVEVKK
ncbi:MAG: hypothetical protein HFI70_04485 [Lachnospiraceae bacterium]|nr:hypothetical protein [Lachnospiraceae bacterium]